MRKHISISLSVLFCLTFFACDFSNPGSVDTEEQREIVFTTLGSSFSPMLEVDTGATVRWTWADGTTSPEANPSKTYGSVGARENRLLVTPWSALKTIDIGYDGGDGGTLDYATYNKADQHVSAVENLDLAKGSLVIWCSSYNNIPMLDFSGFTKLETIECFYSNSLFWVNLDDTPALKRACFENCDLISLDLTGSPNLEDLRGALNDYPTITFGKRYPNLWHICVRENESAISDQAIFANTVAFPAIRELFIWNDNQSGTLRVTSTGPGNVSIMADSNKYTKADFSGALTDETSGGAISMRNNQLTSVNITGCAQLNSLDLASNALDQSQVDDILAKLDSMKRSTANNPYLSYSVNLSGNAAPSAAGQTSAASLASKGWTVTVSAN